MTEQSGIKASDGGFQLTVKGDTTLAGGVIASTDAAVQAGVNRLDTTATHLSDLHNQASYKASAYSVNVGVSGGKPSGSVGIGQDSGSAASDTRAGISGISGNSSVRSGDAETGIANPFDAQRVAANVGAQVAITAEFGRQAPRAWADYAQAQYKAAQASGNADDAAKWAEGGAYRVAGHTLLGGLSGGVAGAAGAASSASLMPMLGEQLDSSNLPTAIKQAIGMVASATLGAVSGGAAGAAMGLNVDVNNRQLHPSEARLIKDNAKEYARLRGISQAQAEAELVQQSLRNIDSAHDQRLGGDNAPAQAFLKALGAGQAMVDPLTGQRFELFAADGGTRDNHAQFGQYAKLSAVTQAALDTAYQQAFKPTGAQTLAGLNGSNAGALTGSDLALNDAAKDYADMRQQPQVVQWAVLGQLRQERAQNLQTQQQLLTELQGMNQRGEAGNAAAQRRGQLINQLGRLEYEDQVMRQASVAQLQAMGSTGTTNPARHREWVEGVGEGIAASRMALQGMSAANLAGRIATLKGAVEEVQAASAVAKAEAAAVARARVENNFTKDGSSYHASTWQELKGQTDAVRKQLPDMVNAKTGKPIGNAAAAEINVYGEGRTRMQAHSQIGNDAASAREGFVSLPPPEQRILRPLPDPRGVPREVDTEYKILENFAQQHQANPQVQGSINLFTERAPCVSCTDVIESQFTKLYRNVEVRLYHNNGEITVYKGSSAGSVKMPSSNEMQWPASPDMPRPPVQKKGG